MEGLKATEQFEFHKHEESVKGFQAGGDVIWARLQEGALDTDK